MAAAAGAAAVFTDPAGAELAAPTGLPVLVADEPRALLGALSAAVWGDPTAGMLVLGVTGTNGKTTTAYLLEEGLRAAGHTHRAGRHDRDPGGRRVGAEHPHHAGGDRPAGGRSRRWPSAG